MFVQICYTCFSNTGVETHKSDIKMKVVVIALLGCLALVQSASLGHDDSKWTCNYVDKDGNTKTNRLEGRKHAFDLVSIDHKTGKTVTRCEGMFFKMLNFLNESGDSRFAGKGWAPCGSAQAYVREVVYSNGKIWYEFKGNLHKGSHADDHSDNDALTVEIWWNGEENLIVTKAEVPKNN